MVNPPDRATTCPYCGVGCGVLARASGPAALAPVKGDPEHPANRGRLCIKGSSLHETLGEQGRLLAPEVDGRRVGWDRALDEVASRLAAIREQYGPDAIAFYLSGQLLTEDYYVANKLAKGFIGTPHVDTNSRLCMSSAVASYKRAFGADAVPTCYEDLELADLLVLVGSNAAWNHPVLYQRMKAAGVDRPGRKVVVVDPRRTATCELADLHLQLRPGTDAFLFNGLLVWLAENDGLTSAWIAERSRGLDAALEAARRQDCSPDAVARVCDLDVEDVLAFYQLYLNTPRTVTFYSQGINQSQRGTDQGNAIINCHLATGRVGLPGAGPFSITGQPNAMGGREVGGLANQLAAHTDYGTPGARECIQGFWGSPQVPTQGGLKAVDLFEAVAEGRIKAVWVLATNPAVSLPNAARVRAALAVCPLVIVSDCVNATDTLEHAHIKLPAQGWSEKDGTVTNSERRISRQRGLLPAVGEARPDWWTLAQVGCRLGYSDAFAYRNPADIFREHAALSAQTVKLGGAFDISALAELTDAQYRDLSPVQWPVNKTHPLGTPRLFGTTPFCTADGRARFLPVDFPLAVEEPGHREPGDFRFNTGRLRDQWHTMTRTGRSPRLWQHSGESFLAMAPEDARSVGAGEGELVTVSGRGERLVLRLRLDSGQRPGEVFAPIHWSGQWARAAAVGSVIAPVCDPVSGQPAFKHGRVRVRRMATDFHAILLRRQAPAGLADFEYWSRTPLANVEAWRLAGAQRPDDLVVEQLLGGRPQLEMSDAGTGRQRFARLEGQRLESVLLVEPEFAFPALDWLDSLFGQDTLDAGDRRSLLAASPAGTVDSGAVVCSCFQVGEQTIRKTIEEGCTTVEALGKALQCGTNCGSCVPELKSLIGSAVGSPEGESVRA